MPKWFAKILFYLIVLGLLAVGILGLLSYFQLKQQSSAPPVGPVSTVNATALARYTPTPGHSVPQNATAVVIAKPTPYVEWTPYDAQVFIEAMRSKAYTRTRNLIITSELGAPGAGTVCIRLVNNILGIYTVKIDTYCRISLTWTDWQLVVNPEKFDIKVEEGRHVQTPAVDENGNDYLKEQAMARVTITVNEVGLNSPGTRFDQRFDFYKDVKNVWNLAIDIKAIFFGQNIRQQANELTADAPDLALADSFAPLMPDGSRSALYSDQLYAAFVESLTKPGEQHVYNTLLDTATLVAGFDQEGHNFAGLESLTVVVPAKPGTPCDYVYADDMKTKVLPSEYCRYTFTATGIDQSDLTQLAVEIDPAKLDSRVNYFSLINKLFSVR